MRTLLVAAALAGAAVVTVNDTPSRARSNMDREYISWREHLVDDEQLGGVPIRGGDGLQLADFDKDGHLDIVSVHEDSSHVRLAFGARDPDKWALVTLAEDKEAPAAEDVAVGDVNNDGWPDIVVACELAHVIYFQNPGNATAARAGKWPRVIPANTLGRGSFIRVFLADFNRDGRLEMTSPNKGEQLPTDNPATERDAKFPKKPISWFAIPANPLDAKGWVEHELTRVEIPINAQPIDIDKDGDLDILAGARGEARSILYENVSVRGGKVAFREWPIAVTGRTRPKILCAKCLTSFMADATDLNGDGRVDLVMNEDMTTLVWLEQPARLDQPWAIHRIGDIAPDSPTGILLADINGDGNPDVVTGGYSQNPRDRDGPPLTPDAVSGRIAWFENPGAAAKPWVRHDINRYRRGMYDGFVARDMDGDGNLDILGTRGNTGNFDGVFWLEQVRTRDPRKAFQPARARESAPMPLP